MDWFTVVSVLLWIPVGGVGWWLGQKDRSKAQPFTAALPPSGSEDKRFLVVARTANGSRAKQMFERASIGPDEVLEFWDGNACRGRKGPTEG